MLRDLGLLDAGVASAGQDYPRSRLLSMKRCTRSVGITPLLIGCSVTDRVQRDGAGAARNESSAHWTRVRVPELRVSIARQGFAGGKQTGEGPKPFGMEPSSCRISAV